MFNVNVISLFLQSLHLNTFIFSILLIIICTDKVIPQEPILSNNYGTAVFLQDDNFSYNQEKEACKQLQDKGLSVKCSDKTSEDDIKNEIGNGNKLFFGNTMAFYTKFENLANEYKDAMFVLVGEYENSNDDMRKKENINNNLHLIAWEHWKARYIAGYISAGVVEKLRSICYLQEEKEGEKSLYGNIIALNSFLKGISDARNNLYFSTKNVTFHNIIIKESNFDDNGKLKIDLENNYNCGIVHYHMKNNKNTMKNNINKYLNNNEKIRSVGYLEESDEIRCPNFLTLNAIASK
ncbi:hypothetical protein BCR36DRAFT_371333 [Piromyces finnis]|uniref:Uncharacterized protein n=1 Tax=Piromyces finnis TaxID=1754191 RepID=A0A1Y1V5Y2_9FUNG|nr:hypothetical protein BCR36DRAFT_371333 [Piromyces finnis]|eukprot:ORX48081.1 hypothetical protein BCR36DRAFT_371333 [Piromyces finnis]